jgi:hypothetical protein
MLSGSGVLALIERLLADTRVELGSIDTRLARSTAELERLRQAEIGVLSVLARIRMRELEGSNDLSTALDETGRRVKELLEQRESAEAAAAAEVEAAERERLELESARAAQHAVVDAAEQAVDAAEAEAQRKLAADGAYSARLAAAEAADRVATRAEEKAQAAHADRLEKGKPYEADALFGYLWGRGFGTPSYSGVGFARVLDRWVARVADYEPLRRDYWLLTELPGRMEEHARRMRADSDAELGAVRELEQQATAAVGVPERERALAEAAAALAAADARLEENEAKIAVLVDRRATTRSRGSATSSFATPYAARRCARCASAPT